MVVCVCVRMCVFVRVHVCVVYVIEHVCMCRFCENEMNVLPSQPAGESE